MIETDFHGQDRGKIHWVSPARSVAEQEYYLGNILIPEGPGYSESFFWSLSNVVVEYVHNRPATGYTFGTSERNEPDTMVVVSWVDFFGFPGGYRFALKGHLDLHDYILSYLENLDVIMLADYGDGLYLPDLNGLFNLSYRPDDVFPLLLSLEGGCTVPVGMATTRWVTANSMGNHTFEWFPGGNSVEIRQMWEDQFGWTRLDYMHAVDDGMFIWRYHVYTTWGKVLREPCSSDVADELFPSFSGRYRKEITWVKNGDLGMLTPIVDWQTDLSNSKGI